LETAIGLIVGIVATVLVSHYYYRRSISKSLGAFRLLNTFVFEGIAPDVRELLHFRFRDQEVEELQQLVFLIGNRGEKAIRDLIEPLSLVLPDDVEILDASIIHKQPETLQVDIAIEKKESGETNVIFRFPLLNKAEFFIVKMLMSGRLSSERFSFRVLCEDLPRTIDMDVLPPMSLQERPKFEWKLATAATIVLLVPAWIAYTVLTLQPSRPEVFPYPYSSWVPSIESFVILLPAIGLFLLFLLVGVSMIGAAAFGGTFPPSKGPRFPLPKEIRDAVFPFGIWRPIGGEPDHDDREMAMAVKKFERPRIDGDSNGQ
jgi:hypothetical protein